MFFRKSNFATTELFDFALQHRETVDCMSTRLLLSLDTVNSIQFLETLAKEPMVLFFKEKHIEVR